MADPSNTPPGSSPAPPSVPPPPDTEPPLLPPDAEMPLVAPEGADGVPAPPILDDVPPGLDFDDMLAMPPALVQSRKGKGTRTRRRKGQDKDAPGKESWVHGTKLAFFEHRKAEYLVVAEKSANGDKAPVGAFYTKMARLYALKYGYHLKDDQDLAVDVEDPPDEAANVVVNEKEEPGDEPRAVLHNHLRARIGEWYRRKYGGLLKTDKAAFTELFTGVLDGAPPKPQRGQLLHCYSRHFFEARVKDRFEERYAGLKKCAQYTGEAVPKAIAVQNAVTREMWDEETPAMQNEVKLLWEAEYQRALKGWEASLADSPTRTPTEFAATLDNGAYYIQPFADAIAERFGMVVSVLLCGPIGKQQGVVGMQSVHSGTTLGVAPMKWPEWDKARFKEVETRMVEFGRECFTEQQCRARAVGVAPTAGSAPRAEGSSSRGPGTAGGDIASTSTGGRNNSANDHGGTV
ncbi:hypothetical protein B0H16DRAFT_1744594 [Mycena metata]|uniref:Uncharacterized protein n=1 Tax=Mycena metata TaxID=1033252 RepID=A0AAD7H4X9_9AGAR|nr:hypothetical protein B0H16DRAFT_1744594 [Mycena metata]